MFIIRVGELVREVDYGPCVTVEPAKSCFIRAFIVDHHYFGLLPRCSVSYALYTLGNQFVAVTSWNNYSNFRLAESLVAKIVGTRFEAFFDGCVDVPPS